MNTSTILREVLRGRDLSPEEFCFLFSQWGNNDEILPIANEMNLATNGNRVTFVYNRNINYTNICINHCGFCGFRKDLGEENSYLLTIEEIIEKLSESPRITEICIQGGLHPRLKFSYILEMLKEIKARFPQIHIHAFSPMEVCYFSEKTGQPLTLILEALMDSGLDSIPGTAAEILDDTLRMRICPGKVNVAKWIEIIKRAHRLGLRSTATILFGHLETPVQIAQHLKILREIQHETHGFTEFVPLPFVPFHTSLGKRCGLQEMLPFDRMRYFYALSRIFFRGSIPNIQASWPKLGLDQALDCVFSGVNDLGGTLYEENITKSAGGTHGEKVSLGEFRKKIKEVGKTPQLRSTLYEFMDERTLTSLIEDENLIQDGH